MAQEERKAGRPPSPNPKTELLQIMITPKMKEDLELRAYQESAPGEKVHTSTIVRRAIRAYLEAVGL